MTKNQQILDIINVFRGGFIVKASQSQMKNILMELNNKIIELEKKLHVT